MLRRPLEAHIMKVLRSLTTCHLLHLPCRSCSSMLMGAMTVVIQTLTPEEAFDAIQLGTLALLFGMMMLIEYIKDDSVFER